MRKDTRRIKAYILLILVVANTIAPTTSLFALSGGPSQPEVQGFEPAGTSQMVDLSSGSFVYNIPLCEVGGYPLNLSYHSGITMDQEASCVGLGWSLNPGVVNRNMRGLPDDFKADKVTKEFNIAPNRTYSVTASADFELIGIKKPAKGAKPDSSKINLSLNLQASLGISYNNYQGVGFDFSVRPNLSFGKIGGSKLTTGLGLNASTFGGVGIQPDLNFESKIKGKDIGGEKTNTPVTIGANVNFNSRRGLSALTLSNNVHGSSYNTSFKFNPSYTPQYSLPFSSSGITAKFKAAGQIFAANVGGALEGSFSENKLMYKTATALAYGYMYAHDSKGVDGLMDFNRDFDGGFSGNKPNLPIVIPTQDIYSVSGQGIGGSYQLKRSDIGVVYDKYMNNTSTSGSLGFEVGGGNAFRLGRPISLNSTVSSSGKWVRGNDALSYLDFIDSSQVTPDYETAYFKVAGEKTVESDKDFIESIGKEDAVAVGLRKSGILNTNTTRELISSKGRVTALTKKVKREKREKRNQSISWLNAQEAVQFALDKTIKNYAVNDFESLPSSIERTSNFRKKHHISEVTTLREDGVRYVYGIPAYNIEQKEVSFGVSETSPQFGTGLIPYTPNVDNTINNKQGPENYFNRVTTPAYAHSFLLTEVVSPDYVDVDGNGCSKNDIGTYTKFNYTQQSDNYQWRTPINKDSANYSEGFKSEKTDGKGNYIYGKKEIWYVHSVESKNEVARFIYSDRDDSHGVINENGGMSTSSENSNKRLDRIEIYTKAGIGSEISEPIKTIYFKYDYTLCPNSQNVVDGKGKLTLTSIYFTYGNSQKGKLSPYKFFYGGDKNSTGINPSYNLKAYDRWGFYKPNNATNFDSLSNADFPYTVQNKNIAAERATAWNLNKIQLPSGGEINVTYESNDYSYVQDKRTMQMTSIIGLTDNVSSGVVTSKDNLLYKDKKDNRYLLFKLTDPFTGTSEEAKKYVKNMYLNGAPDDLLIYFKCLVSLDGSLKYEYVPGYYKLEPNEWGAIKSSTSANSFDIGYIKLKAAGTNDDNTGDVINPITKAALNFTRMYLSRIAYGEPNIQDGGLRQTWEALLSVGKQVVQLARGFNDDLLRRGYCNKINLDKSWIRLHVPNYTKYGGGCRVKAIDMSDNWQNMAGSEYKNAKYGQEYNYEKEETIADGTTKTISSGVASYEPLIGGDENPFKQPIFYNERHLLAPDDSYFLEGPIGESLYPGPSIMYSKVTVRNIQHIGVKRNATGWTVSEYYTAKDFPTIVKQTKLDPNTSKIRRTNGPSAIMSFLKIGSKDFMTVSQGYAVETNDMHGKPKAQWNYDEKGTKLSGVEYFYKTDPNDPKHLDNTASVVLPNGKVQADAQIGVDYTMLADARQSETETSNSSFNFNVDNFVAFLFITLPTAFPGITNEQTRFQSMSITKIINRSGLLDKVVAYEHGAQIETANLAYDSETGDVLLTRSQNEYKDNHYNFTFPAHWAYEGMQAAYKNNGVVIKGSFLYDNNGYLTVPSNYNQYFSFGDEVACRLGSDDTKAWVIDINKANNQIKLVDERGLLLRGGTYLRVKVMRSGRRNMQATPIAAIKTKAPIINGDALQFNQVLEASATEFSDNWQTGAEVAYYDGYYKTPSLDNPYTVGAKGNWRPMRSWSYLVDRQHLDTSATTASNTRFDGTFKKFNTFWKLPLSGNEQWGIDSTNWTWSKKNTKIDGHSNQLESVDALGRYDARLMGYNNTLVTAIADNAQYSEIAFDSYEDVYAISKIDTVIEYNLRSAFYSNRNTGFMPYLGPFTFTWTLNNETHTVTVNSFYQIFEQIRKSDPLGNWQAEENLQRIFTTNLQRAYTSISFISIKDAANNTVSNINSPSKTVKSRVLEKTDKPGSIGPIVLRENYDPTINQYLRLSNGISHSGQNCFVVTTNVGNSVRGNIYNNISNGENVRGGVKLKAGKYIVSAWIREGTNSTATKLSYTNSEIRIIVDANTPISLKPKGNILDGWQRIFGEFEIPANANKVDIEFVGINNSSYFDDLRIHPFNANMKSFVYDPVTLRLVAELDENNYPTYYEYDKAGNLSHVKKVTEKGVQTVKEVRAGTVKKVQ